MERTTIRQPATTHLSEQEAQPHDRELTSVIPLKRWTQIHSSVSTVTLTSNECTDRKLCFIKTKMPTSNYQNIWRLPSLQMHCCKTKHLKLAYWKTEEPFLGFLLCTEWPLNVLWYFILSNNRASLTLQ